MIYSEWMRYVRLLTLVVLVVTGSLCPFASVASDDPTVQGSATAAFLKMDPSAQSAALGSAYLANDDELSAYFNPAGLSGVRETQTVLTENEIFAGITYRYLSVTSHHEYSDGGFGLSLANIDFGSQERSRVRGDNPVTGLGDFGAGDLAFIGSYGRKLTESLSVGSNLKYVQSQIAGFKDSTFTADLGLLLETPVSGLRFGLTGRNLFGSLQLNRKSDPLPREFQFGGNYDYALDSGRHEFQLGFGMATALDSDEYFFSGLNYDLYRIVSMRIGYNGSQEADDGFTFGFGLQYSGISVDYAFVPFGNLGRQQRFTLGINFGGSSTELSEETDVGSREFETGLEAGLYKAVRFYENGELKRALDLLRSLRKKNPENVDVLLRLSQVQYELGRRDAARRTLLEVLEIAPGNERARKLLQERSSDSGNTVQEADTTPETPLELGRKLIKRGNYARARVLLLEAFDRSPDDTKVLYWLGRVEDRLDLNNKARDRFLKILNLDPDNTRAQQAFMEVN